MKTHFVDADECIRQNIKLNEMKISRSTIASCRRDLEKQIEELKKMLDTPIYKQY